MASEAERAAMRRAVALARETLGHTYPNPPVGAVVLDAAGEPAGEGRHEGRGTAHAEVAALAAAGERARGGTVVVTLEPCRHVGRVGACTAALLDAGVARVVYADADPIPAHGGGAAVLAAAGVVAERLPDPGAAALNEPWLLAETAGRPYVTWKYAASLDGRVSAADGSSRWITSPEARADAHRLRSECDAVLVGAGTVLADDPQLTVRTDPPPARQPLRVVADSRARTPLTAKLLDGAAPTLVVVAEAADPARVDALRGAGADVEVAAAGPDGRIDPAALLRLLRKREIVHVLLEGGPVLAGTFAAADLVDRVVGYVAPCLLGEAGRPVLAGPLAATIAQARRLRLDEVTTAGPDARLTFRRGDGG